MKRILGLCALALALLLAACGEMDNAGEALSWFNSTPRQAYIGENYEFPFIVSGGLAPYQFELRSGKLPPGLKLENGTLSGIPTAKGRYAFSVMVSDANLSQKVEDFSVEVTDPPPATLTLNVPATEVSDTVRIPITVKDARKLQALRTRISWNAERFALVSGSLEKSQRNSALLHQEKADAISIDLVFLGPAFDGEGELFSFELRAKKPSRVALNARTEYLNSDGKHAFSAAEAGDQEMPAENSPEDKAAQDEQGAANDPATPQAESSPETPQDTPQDRAPIKPKPEVAPQGTGKTHAP